ncbi:MAG: hypothetical protein AAFX86_15950 [Pseudomonadota bacterium]
MRRQIEKHGLTSDFWVNPFVLGFFGGSIGILSKLTPGYLKQSDAGFLMIDVFEVLTHGYGDATTKRYVDLCKIEPLLTNLKLGIDNAITFWAGTFSMFRENFGELPRGYASEELQELFFSIANQTNLPPQAEPS